MSTRPAGLGRQAWRFICVGAANTVLCGGLIAWARLLLGWPALVANGAGYAVGIGLGYWAHSRWTFAQPATTPADRVAHSPGRHDQPARYLAVMLGAWLCNAAVVKAMLALGSPEAWAHVGGFPVYTVSQFIGLRWWALRSTRN